MPDRATAWLSEDHADEDVTSRAVLPDGAGGRAELVAREPLVLAGTEPAREVLGAVGVDEVTAAEDGDRVEPGEVVLEATGSAHALLAAERTAANALAHLSGIATATARAVEAVEDAGADCQVLATRKTTPGLRELEHAAVEAGGGAPHREHLAESVLVKDNHLAFVTAEEAVEAARRNAPDAFVVVEADTVDRARGVARAGADGLLIDNMDPETVADVARLARRLHPSIVTEASGGITRDNVAEYAPSVDRVSLGSLTHSAPSADLSMRVEPV
jgi:nicotinate-nucleotide pyrophosphorylase (carboxylating)